MLITYHLACLPVRDGDSFHHLAACLAGTHRFVNHFQRCLERRKTMAGLTLREAWTGLPASL